MISKRITLLVALVTVSAVNAQYNYHVASRDYQPVQYQQQQQNFQQYVPENPEKLTGYEARDVIPTGENPLKNPAKVQGDAKYVDFINTLYRFDRSKPALQFDEQPQQQRFKRAIIFRPMFVYKQQKVRKEKINAQRAQEAASNAPQPSKGSHVAANQSPYYKDKDNRVYKEYNSFYEPYRYGQRFPYRAV